MSDDLRAIDAQIAELMGWVHRPHTPDYRPRSNKEWYRPGHNQPIVLPAFTRYLPAAWLIVECLRQKWDRGEDTASYWTFEDCGPNAGWRVRIEYYPDHDAPVDEVRYEASTLPLAICRAALKALEDVA